MDNLRVASQIVMKRRKLSKMLIWVRNRMMTMTMVMVRVERVQAVSVMRRR